MLHVDLTSEEQQTLTDILESSLSDLRMEISETETHDYKQMLKHREEVIRKLLKALQETAAPHIT